jgi:hypothetical protein
MRRLAMLRPIDPQASNSGKVVDSFESVACILDIPGAMQRDGTR